MSHFSYYRATHESVQDGSTAMCVGEGISTIFLVNEDGYSWNDPIDQWRPISGGEAS